MKKPKPPLHEGVGQLVVKIDGKLTWSNIYLKVFPDSCSLCIFNSVKDSNKVKSSIDKIQLQTVTKLQKIDRHAIEIIDSLNPRIIQFTKNVDCDNWYSYLEEFIHDYSTYLNSLIMD